MKPHLAILLQTILLASSQQEREAPGLATEAHIQGDSSPANWRNAAQTGYTRQSRSQVQDWREVPGRATEAHIQGDSSPANWRKGSIREYTRQSRSQAQDWNAPVAYEQGVRSQGEAYLRDSRMDNLKQLANVRTNTDVVGEWSRGARGEVSEDANELSAKGQSNEENLYPSRRELAARKKKKPAQPTSTPRIDDNNVTDRQTNRYHEKLSTATTKYGTSTTAVTGAGAGESTPKPTKYHYYPHNQHIYLLPECAIQQVCNAVYVRLNYTQPLCACPSRKEPCSASLNTDDLHTTELATAKTGKILTLVKTCEPVTEMRVCRAPRDWSLLALQNIRTGKSHYLVICRCPDSGRLEGPMSHDQPAYASVPGIRVYGMMCVRDVYRKNQPLRSRRSLTERRPPLPWDKIREFKATVQW